MALDMVTSPVPVIEISFAPPEEPQPEPYSPFTPLNQGFHGTGGGGGSSSNDDDEDGYRSSLLTPPAHSYSLSPLRSLPSSSSKKIKGQGLKDEAFQALLRASKERSRAVLCSSASASAQKKKDLRKEVAIKAHKNKQAERRALFLSKIGAPPSPTAISLPKTPPESPAIFHYSLPSPGLVSPLEHFERLELGGCAGGQGLGFGEDDEEEKAECGGGRGGMYYVTRKRWVEQVDFRTLGCTTTMGVRRQQQQQQKVLAGNSLEEKEPGPRPGLMLLPTITVTTGESEETQDVQGGVEGPSEVQRRRVQEQQQKRNGHGHARKTSWPSLEQIMERYSGASTTIVSTASTAAATATSNATDAMSSEDKNEAVRVRAPLPAFIVAQQQQRVQQVKQVERQPEQQQQQRQARPRLTCTGRIRFPSREITTTTTTSSSTTTSTASANTASAAMTTADDGNGNVGVVPRQRQRTDSLLPSSSPSLTIPAVHVGAGPISEVSEDKGSEVPSLPTFEITITQVPDAQNQNRNQNRSRHQLTEANLEVFNSRTRTAKDMLCALRRRTAAAVGVGGVGAGVGGRWDGVNANANGMGSRVKTGAGYGYNHNYNYNLNYTYNRNLNSNLGGCMNGIGGGSGCIGIGMGGGMSKLGYGPGSLLSPRAPWTGDNNGNVNDGDEYGDEDVEKHRRRNSAPAELPTVNRFGFMHPVLALPAGF